MNARGLLKYVLPAAVLCLVACSPSSTAGRHAVPGSCTSFYLDNDGRGVFGTNFDNDIWEGMLFVNKRGVTKRGWEAGTTGQYALWTAEYGSVTFNLAGIQMAWAGMNEAGLVISTMGLEETSDPPPDERSPLMTPLWIQYQLDTCATVEEVMANDTRVRVVGAVDHYLTCDGSGDCAVVEFLDGTTVFHTGAGMPIEVLTNHPYRDAVLDWRASNRQGHSRQRFAVAADRVSAFQPGDSSSAVEYAFETLYLARGPVSRSSPTQWSIVFDGANSRVHFRTSRNPEVRTVSLAGLDFGCATPVKMLDVHAPLSGDITGQLEPCGFQENLQATVSFLSRWGGGVSPLEAEILERGHQTYACAHAAIPNQEERTLVVPPVVGWAVLALLYRYWAVGLVLVLGVGIMVAWRVGYRRAARRARSRPLAEGRR